MKKLLAIILFVFLWNSSILAEENKDIKKFKQALENKQITSEEFNKLRKWDKEKNLNKNIKKKKKKISLSKNKNKNFSMNFLKKDEESEIENYQINELGEPKKISDDFFKKLMKKEFKGCTGFTCKGKGAGKYIYITFNKGPNWSARNSGKMIKAMAMYEIFYAEKLYDARKEIERYKKNNYDKKLKILLTKKQDKKKIKSLIGINTARKTMRSSLGMTMETPVEEAITNFWVLGEFLELGKAVKNEKNSESIKERKDLIDAYKLNITALKKKIEDNKLMRENL
jgi:hypothetical protein